MSAIVQFTTRRGRLRYSPELFAPIEWIAPGAQGWARFAADMDLIGVWDWTPKYDEFTEEGRVLWCLDLQHGARILKTAG